MAAKGSIIETLRPERTSGIRELTLDWLSDADGNVSGIDTEKFNEGEILKVAFVPDGGDTAPTTLYDVTLLDANDIDILLGRGADRSATVTVVIVPILNDGQGTPQYFGRNFTIGPLELVVAAAGAANGGKVIITFRTE